MRTQGANWSWLLVVLAWASPCVFADTLIPTGSIRPDRPGSLMREDLFGSRIDIDGDTMAVAAPEDSIGSRVFVGSVSIFERINGAWVFRTRLVAPEQGYGHRFGESIELQGNVLVVGSKFRKTVHVFERQAGAWSLVKTLQPNPDDAPGAFGQAVALRGNRIYIGAPGHVATCNPSCTTMYISQRSATWSDPVPWPPGVTDPGIGNDVAISDDGTLVIASEASQTVRVYDAAAHPPVFVTQLQRQRTSPAYSNFGRAVDISGSWIAVGAPGGACVEMFGRVGSTWQPRGVLDDALPVGQQGSLFGVSLDLHGSDLFVTTSDTDASGVWSRGVRSFRLNGTTWTAMGRQSAPDDSQASVGRRFALGAGRIVFQELTTRYGPAFRPVPQLVDHPISPLPWTEGNAIVMPPGVGGAAFGTDVASIGDFLLVAMPGGQDPGGLQVFRRDGFLHRFVTTLPGRTYTVHGSAAGAVVSGVDGLAFLRYDDGMFHRAPFVVAQDLTEYGSAVAMGGNTIALRAREVNGGSSRTVVEMFDVVAGVVQVAQRIEPPSPLSFSFGVGMDVDVDGATLAIGSPDEGTVTLYRRTGGTWTAVDVVGDSSTGMFGVNVSLRHGRLVVAHGFPARLAIFEESGGKWSLVAEPEIGVPGARYEVVQTEGSIFAGAPERPVLRLAMQAAAPLAVESVGTLPYGGTIHADDNWLYLGNPNADGVAPLGNPSEGLIDAFAELPFANGFESMPSSSTSMAE